MSHHNCWTFTTDRSINSIPSAIKGHPHFQIRHISGQSGVEITGIWPRVFLWLSESPPVAYAQDFLLFIHNSSGLPWWTTIILTTVFLRTAVTLPLAFYQNYILAKVENLHLLEMPEIVKELKKETAIAMKQFNWTENQARRMYNRSLQKQWNNLIIRDNCHPLKASILLWVQLPMWVFVSVALRNMVYLLPHSKAGAMVTYMELSVGGFGWIPNLLVPDESLILPVSLGLINLAIVELQTMSKIRKKSKLQQYVTHFFRLFSIATIPIAASVPSCLNLYWVTSSAYGLVQNLVLLSPRVKRFGHIPETPSQLSNPYKHIASEIKLRANRLPAWWKSRAKN
ncbi:Mitochondrial inner membrane protein COX18 [Cryptotermes secundus]|uniref:Mitochondrial inner membrane protein COX18 n=2 Tax=Cryptotermes secundus TaxID=105785 RepID=A0A2J7QPX3_9NEOP|nr:Mitochondrial inner membrane protein COX18 [Cryptotermes secundus]